MAKELELRIDGLTVVARLLEDKAPKSCQALWDVLPLELPIRHLRYGGYAGYAVERKLGDAKLPFENKVTFCLPATITLKPSHGELAFAYGPAQARTLHGVNGNEWASYFADIVGDPTPFFDVLARTLREGKKQMTISRRGG